MKLTQIELRTKFQHKHENEFNRESWCIPELYWSSLKKYDTGKVKKCVVRLDNDWGIDLNKITLQANVIQINLNFNFNTYYKCSITDKKMMQLKILHVGMIKIWEEMRWDVNVILDAYNYALKKDLKYEFLVSEKLKASPNRKHYINFWCEWDLDCCKLYWVLYNKQRNEISRELIIKKEAFLGEFVYYIKYKWVDNKNVTIENKHRNNEVFNIRLDKYLSNSVD